MIAHYKRQDGFMVAEAVVVLPIIVIIVMFLAFLAMYQYWVFNTENTELTISGDARSSLDMIGISVRGATMILSSYSGYETGSQTLVLQTSAIDAAGIAIAGFSDRIVFYLSGTDLMMRVFPGSGSSREEIDQRIASNIDGENFNFAYNAAAYSDATIVTTTMALSSEVRTQLGNQVRSITLSSRAKLRAYNE